jgi:hypothetical protein
MHIKVAPRLQQIGVHPPKPTYPEAERHAGKVCIPWPPKHRGRQTRAQLTWQWPSFALALSAQRKPPTIFSICFRAFFI